MVRQADKERMTMFIAERLMESGLYIVREQDASHLLVEELFYRFEEPERIYVAAHDGESVAREVAGLHERNRQAGLFTAHVIYDNGSFTRQLIPRERRYRTSLELYKKDDVRRMARLRGLERAVLRLYPQELPELAYYRPTQGTIPEHIMLYWMGNVRLSRRRSREAFEERIPDEKLREELFPDERARAYKLPHERAMIATGAIHLKRGDPRYGRALIKPYVLEKPRAEKPAQLSFSDPLRGEIPACCVELALRYARKRER